MAGQPSVVLVDDGELDRVRVILERLGVDFALCRRPKDGAHTPAPRDLLITTGRRALARKDADDTRSVAGGPLWLCVHGQDFRDLRAELRALGVHYLVHSAVDQDSLRLLIAMLLHDRAERRSGSRLPLGCEVTLRAGRTSQYARLLEISHDGARLRCEVALESGDWVQIDLPRELASANLDSFSGHVARAQRCTLPSGAHAWLVAVELDPLTPEGRAELESILQGTHPGTRISPLAAPPEELQPEERRRSPRRAYKRRVAALTGTDQDAPRVALGQDLSADGIRIAAQPGFGKGTRVALGLYGAEGGSPLVIEAEVVADYGPRGLGLEFRDTDAAKRRALEELVAGLPPLESFDEDGTRRGLVVSELMIAAQKS